jgi:dTDP-4-dehydrorhamnose 3,5-epimerase
MEVIETALPAVKRLKARRVADGRGFFSEIWSEATAAALGVTTGFVQDNLSCSRAAGTLRGLHCQAPPHAQAKFVTVVRGSIRDVAVDVRRGSDSYGRWVAETLSAEDGDGLLVPEGFLHGFVTLEPDTWVLYKVSRAYAPQAEAAVRFDDRDLAIDWGVGPDSVVLSARDAAAPAFRTFESPFAGEARR